MELFSYIMYVFDHQLQEEKFKFRIMKSFGTRIESNSSKNRKIVKKSNSEK